MDETELKATETIGQKKELYRQRIPESTCVRKETDDIDLLVTFRNGDLNQFRGTSTQLIPIEKT